jgi:hypothetical protein
MLNKLFEVFLKFDVLHFGLQTRQIFFGVFALWWMKVAI